MTSTQLNGLKAGDTFTYRSREYTIHGWAGSEFGSRNGREYVRIPVFAKRGGKSFVTVYLTD